MYHYYMFNKPYGCVTAKRDERYPVVMDYFKELGNENLNPVGRLDRETEGLLIITDDGEWNQRMTHPRYKKEKEYEFIVLGDLTEEKRNRLEQGIFLNGSMEKTKPARVTVTGTSTLVKTLSMVHPEVRQKSIHNRENHPVTFGRIVISEGRKRQIRRMMKAVGCLVLGLKRISMGDIVLDENLAPGEWKEIRINKEEKTNDSWEIKEI